MKHRQKMSSSHRVFLFGLLLLAGSFFSTQETRAVSVDALNLNTYCGTLPRILEDADISVKYGVKDIFTPGENIVVSEFISSMDHPISPVNGGAFFSVSGQGSTGDIDTDSYTDAQLIFGVDKSYDSSNSRVLVAPMTPGTFTMTFGASMHYTGTYRERNQACDYRGPRPETVTLTVVDPPKTGTINVTSNIAGANYTITGPETIPGSGTSSTFSSKKIGSYTITWGAVSGYTAPSSSSLTLTKDGTINFQGNYAVITPTINVHF